jgi:hypothetical protein
MTVLSIGISGCMTYFEMEYETADRLRVAAASAGYEWIETETLLQEAQAAHAAGDVRLAFELVDKARFQAEAALGQAEYEAEAWRGRVVR